MNILSQTNELVPKRNCKQNSKKFLEKQSDDNFKEILSPDSTTIKSEIMYPKIHNENPQRFPLSWVKVGNAKYCYFYKKEMVVKSKQNSESELKKPFLRRASEIILTGLRKIFSKSDKQTKLPKRYHRHHHSLRNTLYVETTGIDTFKGYSSTFESKSVDLVLDKILEKEVCRCHFPAINPEPKVHHIENNWENYLGKSLDSAFMIIKDSESIGNLNLHRSADNIAEINDNKVKAMCEHSLNIHQYGRYLLNDLITNIDRRTLSCSERNLLMNKSSYGEGSQFKEKNIEGEHETDQSGRMNLPKIRDVTLSAENSKSYMKGTFPNGYITKNESECQSKCSPLIARDDQHNFQGMNKDGIQFPLNRNKSNHGSLRYNFSRTSNSIKMKFKSILLGKFLAEFPAEERICRCLRRKQRHLLWQNAYSENNVPSSCSSLSMESCDLITMKHNNTDDAS